MEDAGDLGVAYRRDDTYHLTDTYYSVDLSGANLEMYADQANTRTVFSLHRNYNLDPRSNRSGASAIVEKDDSGTTIYDYSYSLSTDDMDLYTDVDGDAYNYDAIEQRTFDAATGLHYAHDYRGYLWHVDINADLATPEQVYHHDCAGNRVLEEGWYDGTTRTNAHKTVLVNDIRGGGCGSGNGESKSGEIRYNSLNTVASTVQYVFGKGKSSIVHELASNGINTIERYRHEDQAGSLVGITDENGLRTDEYFYLDFGTPIHRPIAFDGQNSRIASVQANTPFAGSTRVNLKSGISIDIPANSLNVKQVRVLGSMHVDKVLSSSDLVIDLNDPDGDLYAGLNAGAGFVVMDFESPEVYSNASGTWTEVYWDNENEANETVLIDENTFFEVVNVGDLVQPDSSNPDIWFEIVAVDNPQTIRVAGDKTAYTSFGKPYEIKDAIWEYDSLSNTSTYTNENAYFEQFQAGWLFTPDVTKPAYLQIISIDPSGESITVKGNATNLSDQWRIHAPPGVKPETSGQYEDLTETGSKYLLSGARYIAPQAGFHISSAIEGEQSGSTMAGVYHHGNSFDPTTGVAFQDVKDNEEEDYEPKPLKPALGVNGGSVKVYDHDRRGRKGYIFEYINKGVEIDCYWSQLFTLSMSKEAIVTVRAKGASGNKENSSETVDISGDHTVTGTGNRGKTTKIDGKTSYVDSAGIHIGYVEGGGYGISSRGGLFGGKRGDTAKMIDRPEINSDKKAIVSCPRNLGRC